MGLLDSIAAKGRNGDTRLAHLTPGEVIIPKEVAAMRPDLVAHIGQQIRKMGGNPNTIVAGRGRKNPQTGIEEFATADEVKAAYQTYLGREADAAGLDYWMNDPNFSADTFKTAAAPEFQQNADKLVSGAYQQNFGRDAEKAGVDYWVNDIKSGNIQSYADLTSNMKAGASFEDQKALADGAKYLTAWRSDIDPNKDKLVYDPKKDAWNPQVALPIQSQYAPNFNSIMNDETDTIEGRMQRILAENGPLIRQTGERVMQQFTDRGLLNSSMAQQAAQEAMISKAIDIAGPDAERYFQNRWKNTDWNNKFAMNEQMFNYDLQKQETQNEFATDQNSQQQSMAMQTNYQSAISNIDNLYKQQTLAVQSADMEPKAKEDAVEGIRVMRDNSIRLMTAAFQQFPGWSSEWSKLVSLLG
jgi:hypothetical protein